MIQDINYKWNSNLAYIVGLITTDGNLSKDKRHIFFTTGDHQLMDTFKNCLGIKNRVRSALERESSKKQTYRVSFGNRRFYVWLENIGLMPNKTYNLGKINVPKKYFRDFLRGHLDGDGSVFTYTDRYMEYKGKRYTYQRLYTAFHSISFEHLKWLQTNIKEIIKIKGALAYYTKKDRKMKMWKLRFAKKDSLKLLSWLYYKPNLPCLYRKRKIAERFLKPLKNRWP